MKNSSLTIILIIISLNLLAHEGGHGTPFRNWKLASQIETIKADFIKYDQNIVWLSDPSHKIIEYGISDFSAEDQKYILDRHEMILSLNNNKTRERNYFSFSNPDNWLILFGCFLLLFAVFQFLKRKKKLHLTYGILGVLILVVACKKEEITEGGSTSVVLSTPANDIGFMSSLFESFADVSTSSDNTYFYVSSTGIPDHKMMVGITSWQQQVPVSQDYTGSNSWAIPLQPILSDMPLSLSEHFMKGAIAIGINGVPIFNPLNNRGEDAKEFGELDQWGGHCGKADDYHYHLPPTHLAATVGNDQPIAYALDGFPIYGETTNPLDEYLGILNADGSYQYHTISDFPYFMAGIRGVVSLDPNTTAPEDQILPQAMSNPMRGGDYGPLSGAAITNFTTISPTSRSLEYQIGSDFLYVNYSWDNTDEYTFTYIDASGHTTVETYQR